MNMKNRDLLIYYLNSFENEFLVQSLNWPTGTSLINFLIISLLNGLKKSPND